MTGNPFNDFPTGLLTGYDFYIEKASFNTDAKYTNNDGTTPTFLFLTGRAVKDGVLVNDMHEERYKCPPDWKSNDGGITVQKLSEPDGNFNANSQIAKLFIRVSEVAPELVKKWLGLGATPQESSIWLGEGFHMEELVEKWNIDGKDIETRRNLPVSYLGETSGNVPGVQLTLDEGSLVESLRPVAVAATNHEDFVNKAIAIDGVTGYPGLVKRLADPNDLYAELKG